MKSAIQPLAKSILIPLALTAAASPADTGIQDLRMRIYNTNNIK